MSRPAFRRHDKRGRGIAGFADRDRDSLLPGADRARPVDRSEVPEAVHGILPDFGRIEGISVGAGVMIVVLPVRQCRFRTQRAAGRAFFYPWRITEVQSLL